MKDEIVSHIQNFIKKIQESHASNDDIDSFLKYFDAPKKIEIFNKYRINPFETGSKYRQPIIHWLILQNNQAALSKIINANIFDLDVKDSCGHKALEFLMKQNVYKVKKELLAILLYSPIDITQILDKSKHNLIGLCIISKNISLLIFIFKTLINAQREEDIIKLIRDSKFDITHSKRYSNIVTLLEEKGMSDVLEITKSKATPYDQAEEPQAEIVSDAESSSDIDIRQASDQIPPPLEYLQQAMLESNVESHTALPTVLESKKSQQPEVSMEVISNYLEKHRFGLSIYQELCYRRIDGNLIQHRFGTFEF